MHNVNNMLSIYNDHQEFKFIQELFAKRFNLEEQHVEHTTKRYILDVLTKKKSPFSLKKLFKSFITSLAVLFYLFLSSIFYIKRKSIKADVLFDIFGDNVYNRYYKTIHQKLSLYNTGFFQENSNKFFQRRVSIKLFFFLVQFIPVFLYLSYRSKFNFLDLILRHCRKIGLYTTDTDFISCKCLISARDNTFNGIRYEIYKKNGIANLMLIQGARRDTAKNAKSGDIYCYNDYYFGFGLALMDKMYGMKSKNLIPVGSIPLYNNTVDKKEIKYDIVIIEEPVFSPVTFTSKEKFDIMINHICKFKKEYSNLNIYYTKKPNRFGEEKYIESYYKRLEKIGVILKDKEINSSYDAINSSKLIIFQGSTMGLEAVGLGKLIMHCNYPHYESHFDNSSLFVIMDDSYEVFKSKLSYLLDNLNSKNLQFELSKLQKDYMNLVDDPANVIKKTVLEILNKKANFEK